MKVERVSVKVKPLKETFLAPSTRTIADSSGATISLPAVPSVLFGQKYSFFPIGS
jgi:hypothetical protein